MERKKIERARARADRWAATDPKMRELRARIDYYRERLAEQERRLRRESS